jgi:hypothetical protein
MPKYTIELDEIQHKIFNHFHNPQDWAETLFVNRANVAMQELFRVELTKAKLNGKLVPADIEQAVLNSDEKSTEERNAEAAATGPVPNQLHDYHVSVGENTQTDAPPAAPGVVRL